MIKTSNNSGGLQYGLQAYSNYKLVGAYDVIRMLTVFVPHCRCKFAKTCYNNDKVDIFSILHTCILSEI